MFLFRQERGYVWINGDPMTYRAWGSTKCDINVPEVYLFVEEPIWTKLTKGICTKGFRKNTSPTTMSSKCGALVLLTPYAPVQWIAIPCSNSYIRSSTICEIDYKSQWNATLNTMDNINMGTNSNYCEIVWFYTHRKCIALLFHPLSPQDVNIANNTCYSMGGQLLILNQVDLDLSTESTKMWLNYCDQRPIMHRHSTPFETIDQAYHGWKIKRNIMKQFDASPSLKHMLYIFNRWQWLSVRLPAWIVQIYSTLRHHDCTTIVPLYAVSMHANNIWHERSTAGVFNASISHSIIPNMFVFKTVVNACHSEELAQGVLCQKQPTVRADVCQPGQFQCSSGECILDLYVCDQVSDCQEAEDERPCKPFCLVEKIIKDTYFCTNKCHHTECLCEDLYFQCTQGGCILAQYQCDMKMDCSDNSDESHCSEWYLRTPNNEKIKEFPNVNLELDNFKVFCSNPNWIPCTPEVPIPCYPRSFVCVYDLSIMGDLIFCKNGNILQNCEAMKCTRMFKCPLSYCIPIRMLCNEQWDCVAGIDENCEMMGNLCAGHFRCKGETICLHITEVCDGSVNCKLSTNDEDICHDSPCPHACQCKGNAITCSNQARQTFPLISRNMKIINFKNNYLKCCPFTSIKFSRILKLDISFNKLFQLTYICFKHFKRVLMLYIMYNYINFIPRNAFGGLGYLRLIHFKGNPIKTVMSHGFSGLPANEILDLSDLGLLTIYSNAFADITIKTLNMSGNQLNYMNNSVFKDANIINLDIRRNPISYFGIHVLEKLHSLNTIYTVTPYICCINPQGSLCIHGLIESPECTRLIPSPLLRALICLIASSCALALVVALVITRRSSKQGVQVLLNTCLVAANMCVPAYIFTVLWFDYTIDVKARLMKDFTAHSILCSVMACIVLLSTFMSIHIQCLTFLDKFIAIILVFKVPKLSTSLAKLILFFALLTFGFFSVAGLPSVNLFKMQYTAVTDICFQFGIADGFHPWPIEKYVFVIQLSIYLLLSVSIISTILIRAQKSRMQSRAKRRQSKLWIWSIITIIKIVTYAVPILLTTIIYENFQIRTNSIDNTFILLVTPFVLLVDALILIIS